MNVAITPAGLCLLQLTAAILAQLPAEIQQGLAARARSWATSAHPITHSTGTVRSSRARRSSRTAFNVFVPLLDVSGELKRLRWRTTRHLDPDKTPFGATQRGDRSVAAYMTATLI